jgi:hypothetical protein
MSPIRVSIAIKSQQLFVLSNAKRECDLQHIFGPWTTDKATLDRIPCLMATALFGAPGEKIEILCQFDRWQAIISSGLAIMHSYSNKLNGATAKLLSTEAARALREILRCQNSLKIVSERLC